MARAPGGRNGCGRRASFLATSCFHGSVDGSFRASGGPMGPWELAPNRCTSGAHAGYLGADMYRDQEGDDTELAVVKDGAGFRVLARVPGRQQMVALTPADCTRFVAQVDYNGVTVSDMPGVSGEVDIECQRPETGRVSGRASFVCY